ncbi:DegV family protein [Macrococcoides caseolyticum]|uniref:DegV family protein n=1 Tax=Macrococcoides caseolyticum TaxID=69966 RepID=UPI001F1B2646|nr:DegV family protein [Macrococcus caseolyticus]MCE4955851.1 DegV family protein [Macrococcus caseolyticus]
MKTAIITDSTAYIPESIQKSQDIRIISLNVIFKDEIYLEENYDAQLFYERMRSEKELPTTSQPTTGSYVELLESLKAEGFTDCIAIHLSSGISGTYQNAITAGNMVDGIKMHAFDSELACMAMGFYVMRAAELKDSHSPETIIEELNAMKQETYAYFLVDDLKNLQKGGRLSGAQALIGSMLQVKPILHFSDTKIVPFDKVRTKKKAIKQLKDLFATSAKNFTNITVVVIHSNAEDEADALIADLKSKNPDVDFIKSYFGPVIGTHLGEKAIGLGFTNRKFKIFNHL